jgi:hypothetical protein
MKSRSVNNTFTSKPASPLRLPGPDLIGLDSALAHIGIRLLGNAQDPSSVAYPIGYDIERTILYAAIHVSQGSDARLFSLLASWIQVHGDRVLLEKLGRLRTEYETETSDDVPWLKALAYFAVECGLSRWKLLARPASQKHVLPPTDITKAFFQAKGRVKWLPASSKLVIARDTVRIRADDVLTVPELARQNRQYRNRWKYGACLRADIVTEVESGLVAPYRIAKKLCCTYEPARRIVAELLLAKEAESS